MSDEQEIEEVLEPGRRAAVRKILLGTMIYSAPVVLPLSIGGLGGIAQARAKTLFTNLYAILDIGSVGSIAHNVVSVDFSDPNNIIYVPIGTLSGFADKYVVSATFDAVSSKIFLALSDSDSNTSVDNVYLYSVTFPDLLTIAPFCVSNTVYINLNPQITYSNGLFYYAINNDPLGYDYSVNTIDNSGNVVATSINTSNLQNSSNGLQIFGNDIYATYRPGNSFTVYYAGVSGNTSGSISSSITPQPPGQIWSTFDSNGVLWGTTQYDASSPPSYSLYALQCTAAGLPASSPFTSQLVGAMPTTFASSLIVNMALFAGTVTAADVLSGTSAPFSANAGSAFSGAVANFTDSNSASALSDFTATVDWGDGTSSAGIVSGGSGAFQVGGTHTYAAPGTFSVSVTMTQNAPGTATATVVSTATINPDVLSGTSVPFSANAGSAFNGTVANFTDSNSASALSDFTATIDWGDGTNSVGTIGGGSGAFQVGGTHTYAAPGTFSVSVTMTQNAPGTATATAVGTATINPDVLSGTAVPFSANAGNAFSGAVANFTDSNTASTLVDFTATIDWGDGASSAGIVSGGSGAFQVGGTHTYAAPGTFSVSVTLAQNAPGTATATVVGAATINGVPDLVVTKAHAGNFIQGQTGATYSLTVSNIGSAATAGIVTVADLMPSGLTPTAISGTGWICDLLTLTCTRSDALAAGASYPAITLTVSVANNAPTSVTNSATVSGGGETNTANDGASDVTAIAKPAAVAIVPAPMLDRPALSMLGGLLAAGVFWRLRRRQMEESDERRE